MTSKVSLSFDGLILFVSFKAPNLRVVSGWWHLRLPIYSYWIRQNTRPCFCLFVRASSPLRRSDNAVMP